MCRPKPVPKMFREVGYGGAHIGGEVVSDAGREAALTEFDLPEVVEIEPTHTCNLRCVMCHVSYEELTKTMLDVGFVKRLKGLEGKWVLLGSNYEPVAHPKFVDLVNGLSDLGMKLELTTNGTLFTDRVIRQIAGANFENVTVSFDGAHKETYEKIRRRANYDRALERIVNFKQAVDGKDVYCAVNYTVMRSNVGEIVEAVDLWEGLGFDHLGFIMMVIREMHPDVLSETLKDEMARVYTRLDEAARRVIENRFRITLSSAAFARSCVRDEYPGNFHGNAVRSDNPKARLPFNPRTYYQNGPFPGMHVNCRSPFKFARIYYDGDVELCYQFKVGNIYEQDFLDIWYGERAQRVREVLKQKPKICFNCDYYRFCVGAGELDTESSANFYAAARLDYQLPKLLRRYRGYDIFRWEDDFYGLPHHRGALDVRLDDVEAMEDVAVAKSEKEVVRGINRKLIYVFPFRYVPWYGRLLAKAAIRKIRGGGDN